MAEATITVDDFGLGISSSPALGLHAKVGTAVGGTANAVYSAGDPKAAKDVLTSGPLLEATASSLEAGGTPVVFVPVAATNAGAASAVTGPKVITTGLDGTSPSPGLTVSSGTPKDAYEVYVDIVKGGAVGTATFKISLDGGDTYVNGGAVYATAATVATFAAETGLTFAFAAGTYVAGERYSLTNTPPTFSASDLDAAFDALRADARGAALDFVHVVGTVGGVSDSAKVTNLISLATAVDAKMVAWEGAYRYAFALLEAPDVPDAAFTGSSAFANFASKRVAIVGGYDEMTSRVSGRLYKRPAAWAVADRVSAIVPSEDPGWVGSPKGSLPFITKLYRDEGATPGLDATRMMTLRTHEGLAGFYVNGGKMMAAPGSDFSLLINRRVMDRACRALRPAILPYLNASLLVDKTTGFIDEVQARVIEAKVGGILRAVLVSSGWATSVTVRIKRDNNILSDGTLYVTIRVVPKALVRAISASIGFVNPALAAAA
jgi:hypothetical protein